jgi:hypothetical protein
MDSQPRSLDELHRAAQAEGSGWSHDQLGLLLACLADVHEQDGRYHHIKKEEEDPLTRALLEIAPPNPLPAAVLVHRLPKGLVASPAALCEIARKHPHLELVGSNRIRRS